MVFAGDLLAQTIASSFGIAEMGIPFYGLYGACSTMGESLSLGAIAVSAAMGHISFVPLPVTCNCRKNFVFHLVMVPSARSLPLDRYRKRCLRNWRKTASPACSLPGSSPLAHTNGYAAITGITTRKSN